MIVYAKTAVTVMSPVTVSPVIPVHAPNAYVYCSVLEAYTAVIVYPPMVTVFPETEMGVPYSMTMVAGPEGETSTDPQSGSLTAIVTVHIPT